MLNLTTGETILIMRRRLGLTLAQAAKHIGMSSQALWLAEHDKHLLVSDEMKARILAGLGQAAPTEINRGIETRNDSSTVSTCVPVWRDQERQNDDGSRVPEASHCAGC